MILFCLFVWSVDQSSANVKVPFARSVICVLEEGLDVLLLRRAEEDVMHALGGRHEPKARKGNDQ
ncbi:hypothetical protein CIPAW_12G020000 [Carya illinoinensis]|uniref:Secreted protein n=1 Tax=Carya illinoinensis TaxID=32201 RepID=A0A8T1NTQ2_CARIL|nr:hypothetical protein CIPAW_12G020000 [Carya illinoinensis]